MFTWTRIFLGAFAFGIFAAAFLFPTRVAAGTFNVSCDVTALVNAILAANDETANPGADTLELAAGCTYTLTTGSYSDLSGPSGLPHITSEIIINGNGATIERSSAGGTPSFRILEVGDATAMSSTPGNLTLNTVTIRNGKISVTTGYGGAGFGGGLLVLDGTATVNNSTFSDNQIESPMGFMTQGGAIGSLDTLNVYDSTFSNNSSAQSGGAIAGALVIRNSTFANNHARSGGAASGSEQVLNSAFFENTAELNGGALSGISSVIANSTFYHNAAGNRGGAYFSGGDNSVVVHNTFFDNDALDGGSIFHVGRICYDEDCDGYEENFVTLKNSIFYTTLAPNNCVEEFGTNFYLINGGGNLVWPQYGCGGSLTHPRLLPPADNGGPTWTMALLPDSPAIDAAQDAACAASPVNNLDQRGVTRPIGAHCDSGAYEADGSETPPTPDEIFVNTTDDHDDGICDGADCSLREAVHAANANPNLTTIHLASNAMYVLESADTNPADTGPSGLFINTNVTLQGNGATIARDASASPFRLLHIHPAAIVSFDHVRVQGGRTPDLPNPWDPLYHGAGIFNQGILALNRVTLHDNQQGLSYECCVGFLVASGGGIYNSGILNAQNSTFSENHAADSRGCGTGGEGGAIANRGILTLINSTLVNNHAGDGAPAPLCGGSSKGGSGGGIANYSSATILNGTLVGNQVGESDTASDGVGGGIYGNGTIKNSLVADSTGGNCAGAFTAASTHNFADDNSCGASFTQKTDAELNLGMLQDNGGATFTIALGSSSHAIDAGDNASCAASDQRGQARSDLNCDISAYEAKYADTHTVIKGNFSSGVAQTFGPTFVQLVVNSGDPGAITITKHTGNPNGTPANGAIGYEWDIAATGSPFNLTLKICYALAELGGHSEAALKIFHKNGDTWQDLGGTVDTVNHCITASNITSLSPFTLSSNAPTAVTLAKFSARMTKQHFVRVKWATGSEFNIVGFEVYRATNKNGQYKKLNAAFINAQHSGDVIGGTYKFTDKKVKAGKTYFYKIEIVFADGRREASPIKKVVVR